MELKINRVEKLKILTEGLKRGDSLVITAPRRYGKTTLIRKVFEKLKNLLLVKGHLWDTPVM